MCLFFSDLFHNQSLVEHSVQNHMAYVSLTITQVRALLNDIQQEAFLKPSQIVQDQLVYRTVFPPAGFRSAIYHLTKLHELSIGRTVIFPYPDYLS